MRTLRLLAACAALSSAGDIAAACDLQVLSPWIREAPPAASSLAGYAVLQNTGAKALTITAVRLRAGGMAMLHETRTEGGVSRMRMLDTLSIPPGGRVALMPGGRHLMLMDLNAQPKVGERLVIEFVDASGCTTAADFTVRPISAGAPDP